jgi:hypothetical protein
MMMTKLESLVINGILNSDFDESTLGAGKCVWTFSVYDKISDKMTPRQFSGSVASCSKKGYVKVADSGTNDASIYLTQLGYDAYHFYMIGNK